MPSDTTKPAGDVVERLRAAAVDAPGVMTRIVAPGLLSKAADEIERLRRAIRTYLEWPEDQQGDPRYHLEEALRGE